MNNIGFTYNVCRATSGVNFSFSISILAPLLSPIPPTVENDDIKLKIEAVYQYFVHILSPVTDNCPS